MLITLCHIWRKRDVKETPSIIPIPKPCTITAFTLIEEKIPHKKLP